MNLELSLFPFTPLTQVTGLLDFICSDGTKYVSVHRTSKLEIWPSYFCAVELCLILFFITKTRKEESTKHPFSLILFSSFRTFVICFWFWTEFFNFCSTYQRDSRPSLITLLPACIHPTRKLVSSLSNFYFPISNFKP